MNILKNDIRDEGLEAMEAALKKSKTLKSICGASGPELDLSRRDLGAKDAKVVAIELKYNGTLTSLNLASNRILAGGAEHIAAVLPECK